MFKRLLAQCKTNYNKMECCGDRFKCDCGACLSEGFDIRSSKVDTYKCAKRMNYYVLKYGSSGISEIYHYLSASKILETFQNQNIKIMSLGCGFAPDYYAIEKYIQDNKLSINFTYDGFDYSDFWRGARLSDIKNANYFLSDVTKAPIDFSKYQIIIICKLLSTLKNSSASVDAFLTNIISAVENTMAKNAVLIFNDFNSAYTGCDDFDEAVSSLFKKKFIRKYYAGSSAYHEPSWIEIKNNDIIYPPNAHALGQTGQGVFFEFRK